MRLRIMDFCCHQGHQAEFFKLNHDFFLSGTNSLKPDWNFDHRPLPDGVTFTDERSALRRKDFDVIMVRSGLNIKRYEAFHKRGAKGIAVIQTTDPFKIPKWIKVAVWNSKDVMDKWNKSFPRQKHFYIPHGYDPDIFKPLDVEQNNRVLSVLNVFKPRARFLGYDLWRDVSDRVGVCDVLGHGNDDLQESIGQADTFQELLETYNRYPVFFNPTSHSAMPRSRCEAMFSGAPIVSTNNYGISRYIRNKKTGFLADNRSDFVYYINKLLGDEKLRVDIGLAGRQTAIKHFHIKKYLKSWDEVLRNI